VSDGYSDIMAAKEAKVHLAVKRSKWQKCRKRPVEVEFSVPNEPLEITTLEGTHSYDPEKDVLIRGVKGELYPCKKDIFEQTYEYETDTQGTEPSTFDLIPNFEKQMKVRLKHGAIKHGDQSYKAMDIQDLAGSALQDADAVDDHVRLGSDFVDNDKHAAELCVDAANKLMMLWDRLLNG